MLWSVRSILLEDDPPDPFAVGLAIPSDVRAREPIEPSALVGGSTLLADAEGHAVVEAAHTVLHQESTSVEVALPSRAAIDATQLDALRRYLAESPFWHVGERAGRAFAYRRFATGGDGLRDSLNGFYSVEMARREWRIVLGFGGDVYADRFAGSELNRTTQSSGAIDLTLGRSDDSSGDPTSYLVLDGHPLVVEIWERSETRDRRMTRAVLPLIESTLASFLRGEPLAPSMRGEPRLDLVRGFQGGLYTVSARLHPPRAGRVYVRAFQVTRETELSASRLRGRTLQTVGTSNDPDELFPYDADLTIYEGDWGQLYAARFELWLVPDDGTEEQRLMSDVFRIEGWMR